MLNNFTRYVGIKPLSLGEVYCFDFAITLNMCAVLDVGAWHFTGGTDGRAPPESDFWLMTGWSQVEPVPVSNLD